LKNPLYEIPNHRENTIPGKERAVVLSKTPIKAVVYGGYSCIIIKCSNRVEEVIKKK